MLIGNLTRDPELRYTSQGTAVCSFGLATNRSWVTEQGEKKENASFHRIVAWDKLAEICSQLLFKGRRVYVEGRLQTRQWEEPSGNTRQITEVVISEMMVLDSRRSPEEETETPLQKEESASQDKSPTQADNNSPKKELKSNQKKKDESNPKEEVDTSDIPF